MTPDGKESVRPAALLGLAILALSVAFAFALFALSDVVRPWVAGGILAAGTASLGVYTAMTLARKS
jgi:hypothetical protein